MPGWTLYAYPYTVLVSLTFGLACRTALGTMLAGMTWAVACVAAMTWVTGHGVPAAVLLVGPSYVANPLIGWLCARLLRRTTADLNEARAAAVVQASALATERERVRHCRALHDRVLQTLESLARGEMVADRALRDRIATQAEWLRTYVERGHAAAVDDLAAGLVAAARAARRLGLRVELNDAALRVRNGVPDLPAAHRDALVVATHQLLAGLADRADGTVLRVAHHRGGVLVTILADGRSRLPEPGQVARAVDQVAAVGGTVTVEPVPYLEIWVPPAGVG